MTTLRSGIMTTPQGTLDQETTYLRGGMCLQETALARQPSLVTLLSNGSIVIMLLTNEIMSD